jgi:hypothetical protein
MMHTGEWFECPLCVAARDDAKRANDRQTKACVWGGAGRGSREYTEAMRDGRRARAHWVDMRKAHRDTIRAYALRLES